MQQESVAKHFAENEVHVSPRRFNVGGLIDNPNRLGEARKHQTVPCCDNFLVAKRLDTVFTRGEEFLFDVGNQRFDLVAVFAKKLACLIESQDRMKNALVFKVS